MNTERRNQFKAFLGIVGIASILFGLVIIADIRSNNDYMDSKPKVAWADDVHNPENEEFVCEVAFNLNIPMDSVTQEQFNERYDIK